MDVGSGASLSEATVANALEWLERKVWLEDPADRRRKGMYLWYCHSRLALYEAAATPFEKYEAISGLLACVKRHQVHLGPKARQRRIELAGELKDLKADPVIEPEIDARTLYLRVDAVDDPARLVPRRGRAQATVKAVIASYEQIAGRHPDTVYGRKAAARAEMLSAEWHLRPRGR